MDNEAWSNSARFIVLRFILAIKQNDSDEGGGPSERLKSQNHGFRTSECLTDIGTEKELDRLNCRAINVDPRIFWSGNRR